MKKKVKLGLSLNQLNYTKSGSVIDRTNNARLNIGYALKKNHQFSFNYTLINKDNFENNLDVLFLYPYVALLSSPTFLCHIFNR